MSCPGRAVPLQLLMFDVCSGRLVRHAYQEQQLPHEQAQRADAHACAPLLPGQRVGRESLAAELDDDGLQNSSSSLICFGGLMTVNTDTQHVYDRTTLQLMCSNVSIA